MLLKINKNKTWTLGYWDGQSDLLRTILVNIYFRAMEPKKILKMSQITSKIKTSTDMENFMRELNLWWPSSLAGFDSKYFTEVLAGRKKLLPIGSYTGFSFNYYTKDHSFTRQHLYNLISRKPELMKFIPSDIGVDGLDRNYLLAVLAVNDRDTYMELYNEYKRRASEAPSKKMDYYGVEVSEEMFNAMENFVSSSDKGTGRIFRTKKKGTMNPTLINLGNQGAMQNQGNINQQQPNNVLNIGVQNPNHFGNNLGVANMNIQQDMMNQQVQNVQNNPGVMMPEERRNQGGEDNINMNEA